MSYSKIERGIGKRGRMLSSWLAANQDAALSLFPSYSTIMIITEVLAKPIVPSVAELYGKTHDMGNPIGLLKIAILNVGWRCHQDNLILFDWLFWAFVHYIWGFRLTNTVGEVKVSLFSWSFPPCWPKSKKNYDFFENLITGAKKEADSYVRFYACLHSLENKF